MTENRLLSLVIARMCGEQTAAQAQELDRWAGQDSANTGFLDVFTTETLLISELGLYRQFNPAKAYAKALANWKRTKKVHIHNVTWWLVAASVVIAVTVVLFIRISPDKPIDTSKNKTTLTLSNGQQILLDTSGKGDLTLQGDTRVVKVDSGSIHYVSSGQQPNVLIYNTLTTPRSGQYHLTLADGSEVWLNSVSRLNYPVAFGSGSRNVEVSGEGYFKIVKDASKPFFVKVNDEVVEVLGTEFNVMAYPEEGGTQTTLLEGHIRIKAARDSVQLQPGEQARIAPNGKLRILKDLPVTDIASWKSGFFYFDHTDFAAVMRQLARWYDIDVVYKGKIPKLEFGGRIPRSSKLKDLLNYFDSKQIHFRLEGRNLIVL